MPKQLFDQAWAAQNRATRSGMREYLFAHPFIFFDLTGMIPTPQLIEDTLDRMIEDGLLIMGRARKERSDEGSTTNQLDEQEFQTENNADPGGVCPGDRHEGTAAVVPEETPPWPPDHE